MSFPAGAAVTAGRFLFSSSVLSPSDESGISRKNAPSVTPSWDQLTKDGSAEEGQLEELTFCSKPCVLPSRSCPARQLRLGPRPKVTAAQMGPHKRLGPVAQMGQLSLLLSVRHCDLTHTRTRECMYTHSRGHTHVHACTHAQEHPACTRTQVW